MNYLIPYNSYIAPDIANTIHNEDPEADDQYYLGTQESLKEWLAKTDFYPHVIIVNYPDINPSQLIEVFGANTEFKILYVIYPDICPFPEIDGVWLMVVENTTFEFPVNMAKLAVKIATGQALEKVTWN